MANILGYIYKDTIFNFLLLLVSPTVGCQIEYACSYRASDKCASNSIIAKLMYKFLTDFLTRYIRA